MKNLSVTQEYLLCTINKKGKLNSLSMEIPASILSGCLIELLINNCIEINEKNVITVTNNLNEELFYLKSIFDLINTYQPIKISKLVEDFIMSGKKQDELVNNIGKSLANLNCATIKNGGIFNNRLYFIPNNEDVNKIIEKIRAELLENGNITDETIALVNLLDKSNQLKQYFSKYEFEKLNARLEQIKKDNSSDVINKIINCVEEIITTITLLTVIL